MHKLKKVCSGKFFISPIQKNNGPSLMILFLNTVFPPTISKFPKDLDDSRHVKSLSFSLKSLRVCFVRAYIINNTWLGLHEDITKLTEILKKNLFPAHLIEKVVNRYITGTHSNHCPQGSLPTTSPTFYLRWPAAIFWERRCSFLNRVLGM